MKSRGMWLVGLALAGLVSCSTAPERGRTAGSDSSLRPACVEDELEYAHALMAASLPDYAKTVLSRLPRERPGDNAVPLIPSNRLAEAEAEIRKAPDTNSLAVWRKKLILADSYLAWGRSEKAGSIYREFLGFYSNSEVHVWQDLYIRTANMNQMLLEHMRQSNTSGREE